MDMDNKLEIKAILTELEKLGSGKNRQGMARFGIKIDKAFGVSVANIRQLAKPYKKQHQLALELWKTGYHEARILAAIVDDPAQVTPEQMDSWMKDFDSWDLCDQACSLFDKTAHAVMKIKEWTQLKPEFQKRAGYSLMAEFAWHRKDEPDQTFLDFLPLIEQGADDERNFVKKAVNWALREIGKRNRTLNKAAIEVAIKLKESDVKPTRWIGSDAYRELTDSKTIARLPA